ncbi:hypothetical protein AB1303_08505 [Saccharolobus solfataricus]|uniref:Uncharacterized protein n=1 Tax=Saccharolobus solfataricus TaxID=2287 RepID=A0A157T6C3_SACSO|nr:hypothetical protein [Saccharolobus solfataricus]SAI86746.1 uncharacterised protein [Saccharolobus solfataricus]
MKWLVLLPLLLTVFATIPISASSSPTIHVYYQRYDSVYRASGINGPLSASTVTYTVSSATYNTTLSDGKAFKVTYNRTVYTLLFASSPEKFEGYVNVSAYTNNTITIKTDLPNLIRIVIISVNETELIWAGFNATDINAYAYINGTGKVVLQFANGSTIANATLTINKENASISNKISLYLFPVTSVEAKVSVSEELTATAQIPRRYSPLLVSINYNGTESNATVNGYKVTTAYFDGTLTPALVWKGEGIVPVMSGKGNIRADFETIEFYGVNGTILGYVHISSIVGNLEIMPVKIGLNYNIAFTELKIVTVSGVKQVHANFMGYTYVNGVPVIIGNSNDGNVTSTAIVNISHLVSVHNHKSILVEITVNSTSRFVVLTEDNITHNVSTVRPVIVNITNLNLNGKVHIAQSVEINTTSQYIIFNVTVFSNSSIIGVYKVENGTLVELNSSNYFMLNGKLEVFDDPSSTYYVVYSAQPSSSSTLTSSSTATSTISTSQISTATSSATTAPLTSTTSTTSSNTTIYIVIGVVLLIIIVVVVLVRRK